MDKHINLKKKDSIKKKATEHTWSVCEEASYYNYYTILKIEHIKKKKKRLSLFW
jgi:hypothetical protein